MRTGRRRGIVDREGGGFSPSLRWVGGGSRTWPPGTCPSGASRASSASTQRRKGRALAAAHRVPEPRKAARRGPVELGLVRIRRVLVQRRRVRVTELRQLLGGPLDA